MDNKENEILRVVDVKKIYRTFFQKNGTVAANGLSFQLIDGECCGLVGPNGAGKTTLIKILLGIEGFDEGRIDINESLGKIGYVPERPTFYESFNAHDNLLFFAKLSGCPSPEDLVNNLLEDFGLLSRKDDPVCEFSKGMRQRLAIARSLIDSPRLLLLDEPFSGLDPSMAIDLRDRLISLREGGVTMIISSHNLAEIQALCDSVAFLKNGKIVTKTSKNEGSKMSLVRFFVENDYQPSPRMAVLIDSFVKSTYFDLRITRSEIPDMIPALITDGARIIGIKTVENDIEAMYRSIFEGEVDVQTSAE